MRLAFLTHSVVSCWNNGNAHFQRGVMTALGDLGHEVVAVEPADGWSRANLLVDGGIAALARFGRQFPKVRVAAYSSPHDLEAVIEGADVVIVHEWTAPEVIVAVARLKAQGAKFLALYHDTHHRAVSDRAYWCRTSLDGFDGILAFGESLAEVYRLAGWGRNVAAWHEAADTTVFKPSAQPEDQEEDLVFIGNWGDEERSSEIEDYLLRPAAQLGASLNVFGVRYPAAARETLANYGARYHGWLANADAPRQLARHKATVHVPRRYYADILPGIPTIRMFEALACGVPLISAPWQDRESLFRVGEDFLMASNPLHMKRLIADVINDRALRAHLARHGLETIRARHTCRHRAEELLAIIARRGVARMVEV
jgi:spore maturation protein CgeB